MSRRAILGGLLAVFLVLAVGCAVEYRQGAKTRTCSREIFAMDTVMSFTAYGRNAETAVDAAVSEVKRLDALLSTGSAFSEVSTLNREGVLSVSEDTEALFWRGAEIYEDTGGIFDFTVYPLMELWGFSTKEYHVPSQEELKEVLTLVDASKVSLNGKEVRLGEGQQVDFGGIAKGYASGRIMEIYEERGISSGMVSLGGNVQVLGRKPDGMLWRIGIKDPSGTQELAAVVSVENCAVVTSGGYERYFEEDGKTYIHIIDPRTGYPADKDLASVTVVSADGTLADALSTSLYIMGLADAVSFWRECEEAFEMVLITVDGEIYATEGIYGKVEAEREIVEVRREE